MRLLCENVWADVEADAREEKFLDRYLSVEVEGREHSPAFQRKVWDGKVHLFKAGRFPVGLVRLVNKAAVREGFAVQVVDARGAAPDSTWNEAALGRLRDYQLEAARAGVRRTRGIVDMPTGCHAPGQGILMYDGTIKRVEDVVLGDRVMGPDSRPRNVLEVVRGVGDMVRIVPTKGESWRVNLDHVLTLETTTQGTHARGVAGRLVDVTVRDWMSWPRNRKHVHKLCRRGVEFSTGQGSGEIDPYVLGLWIGDGTKALESFSISSVDPEVADAVRDFAARWGGRFVRRTPAGKCPVLTVKIGGGRRGSPLLRAMRALFPRGELLSIPEAYRRASRIDREDLLAGLIDSDGHMASGGFDYVSKSSRLARDVAFVARSLGLAAYVAACRKGCQTGVVGDYWRVRISGDCSDIPTRIARKRAPERRQRKDVLRTGFSVEVDGRGLYVGFHLDGDGRYLLEDFTVTHNSGKTSVFVGWALGFARLRWLVMVDTVDLVEQAAARFERYSGGEPAGRIGGGHDRIERFTVATLQSLHQRLSEEDARIVELVEGAQGMVVDECHVLPAETYGAVALRCGAYYRFGTSATPLMRGDSRDFMTIGILGSVVYKVERGPLVDAGILARAEIEFVEHWCPRGLESTGYAAAYKEIVVDSQERNDLIVEMTHATPSPSLVFIKTIAHGHVLERMIRGSGLRAEFVRGETDVAARAGAVSRLQRGDLDTLVTSKIFNKGVDLPRLAGGINAAGGKDAADALQKLGRLMRAVGPKTSFVYRDVLDRGNRWLRAQATARMRAYEADGHAVKIVKREDLRRLVR